MRRENDGDDDDDADDDDDICQCDECDAGDEMMTMTVADDKW